MSIHVHWISMLSFSYADGFFILSLRTLDCAYSSLHLSPSKNKASIQFNSVFFLLFHTAVSRCSYHSGLAH
jgi:hypothetical protein